MKKLLIIFLLFIMACKSEEPKPISSTSTEPMSVQNNYVLGETPLQNPDGTPLLWVNGKQVYRHVMTVTNLNNWSSMPVSPSEVSVETLINGTCMNQSNIGRNTVNTFALWTNKVVLHRYNFDGTDATDTFSAVIIIDYTKRTDSPINPM